jgi:phosphoglycerate dehydrogenase-like enzyme
VLTPHLGSAVVETRDALANAVADNILALVEGRRPPNIYNPEVFDSWLARRARAREEVFRSGNAERSSAR